MNAIIAWDERAADWRYVLEDEDGIAEVGPLHGDKALRALLAKADTVEVRLEERRFDGDGNQITEDDDGKPLGGWALPGGDGPSGWAAIVAGHEAA